MGHGVGGNAISELLCISYLSKVGTIRQEAVWKLLFIENWTKSNRLEFKR